MKKKTFIRLVILISGAVFLLRSCILPIIRNFSESNLPKKEREIKLKKARDEYQKLFKETANNQYSRYSDFLVLKSQNPIVTFVYKPNNQIENHNYIIYVQKINMINYISLDKFILLKKGDRTTSDITEGFDETNGIKFRYSSQHDSLAKNIYIVYDDSLLHKTLLGDNFVNYDFQIKNLNISYELGKNLVMGFESNYINRPNRIFFPKSSDFNLNVSLIKKGSSIYIVTIYPNTNDFKVHGQVLRDLFDDKIETNW